MVLKNWLNRITRFAKYVQDYQEVNPDVIVAPTEQSWDQIALEEMVEKRSHVLSVIDMTEITNQISIDSFDSNQQQRILDRVATLVESHETMRSFLIDLMLAQDLSALLAEYKVEYDGEETIDKNFTRLVKNVVEGKAGRLN